MKILVVGGGVFTWSFLWQLSQLSDTQISEITLIDGSAFIPACSLNSTAIVAARGNEFGISELGDLIQKSWSYWNYLYALNNWTDKQGVQLTPLIHQFQATSKRKNYLSILPNNLHSHLGYLPTNLQNTDFAIEASFMIDPNLWLTYLANESKHKFNSMHIKFNHLQDTVIEVNSNANSVSTQTKTYTADSIIFQTGASAIKGMDFVEKQEKVYGSYLEGSSANLGIDFHRSFSFSGQYNLYYNHLEKKIMLGIYSSKESEIQDTTENLLKIYKQAIFDGWCLPAFNQFKILSGARLKLKKRMPVVGKANRFYYHLGGYKIGYLVSLFQAKELINEMIKDQA